MPHRAFSLEEVATYLLLNVADVEELVKYHEIPFVLRGGRAVFQRSEIDAWASQRILGLSENRLAIYHQKTLRGTREIFADGALIPELLSVENIEAELPAKTKNSVIREMVALAEKTGRVYDTVTLLASVEEREALCSTALPGGVALLHSRHHQSYEFEGSFMVLGRTVQKVPYGAPDGYPTRLFFLICCDDDRLHLHTLARLCLMAQKTDILEKLYTLPDRAAMYEALLYSEQTVLLGKKPEPPAA